MKKRTVLLFCIVLFGFVIRIWNLGGLPGSLNFDEASIGYNSYSLLTTGSDEHGNFMPLVLHVFGDKLAAYSYIDTVAIKFFGLNELAVRLPSALFGAVGIIFIFFIANLLFEKKMIGYIASVMFAISPWSIYFSRAAYEVNVATTFFLAGLYLFLRYNKKTKKSIWELIFSGIFFLLSGFTYASFQIFAPMFFICLVFIFRKTILTSTKARLILIVTIILFSIPLFVGYEGFSTQASSLLVFNNPNVTYARAERFRGDNAPKNMLVEKVLYTKYSAGLYQFFQNYINSFSPAFLFDTGGQKILNNLGSFGNLYLIDSIFLLIGFALLFWNRNTSLPFLLSWLFVGPISSAMTLDAPNSARLFLLMPLFILVESYAMYMVYAFLTQKHSIGKLVLAVLCVLYFLNICLFFDLYFVHFNYQRVRFWGYGMKQAISLTQKYPNYNVVMTGPDNFRYIYFLFYLKYDPKKFAKEAKYYPFMNGFKYVKSFGKYSFVYKIDYKHLKSHTIYLDDPRHGNMNRIYLPTGEAILGYVIKK